ncbi:unnamed protein product [Absidia cylindrospora]
MPYHSLESLSDYDPHYNGGYYGHEANKNQFSTFMLDPNVKMYWVAFFSLLAYWGLLWFLRHAFGDCHHQNEEESMPSIKSPAGRTGEESAPPINAPTGYGRWVQHPDTTNAHQRLGRASRVLGDLILMLLSVLILNTIGQGNSRIVMILTWIFFGFAVFWSIFEAAKESHLARFLFGMIFYGIMLAIGALAFIYGFHGYYD